MPTRRMPVIPRDEAIQLYLDHKISVNALARDYGVSAPYLTKLLTDWKIPLRGRKEAAQLRKASKRDQ
ncbi:transposase [Streptomyces sp. NBC_01803]|uniref:transposase n=1 Tax=Streptomyces sp. NBC_01803 TaxID=2975946 RepID=UPI002DDA9C2D|nr:transposase [Streptomyces sp. NBC_01803]WSA43338.1 transposase [Streptomyces sp. NBC_01803]